MNNLDIVLALFTTPNHRFSRLDTTAAFQAATSARAVQVQLGNKCKYTSATGPVQ
jgi:hypothetical protein